MKLPQASVDQYGEAVVVRVVVLLLPYGMFVVVVFVESDGGTTTVTLRGGGDPSPLLELHAAKASMATPKTARTIFLYVIEDALCCGGLPRPPQVPQLQIPKLTSIKSLGAKSRRGWYI